MRKVIPLIAGALLAGTVGLLRDGGTAEEPRSPRTAPKRKRTVASARQGSGAKRTRAAKAKTAKGRAR
jgi:hypothetical protein